MMILNEELYAKNLLLGKNKDVKSAVKKIGYITRYNAQVLNKSDDDNYSSTVQWMNKHQDNFDESSYSNVISKAIKGSKKRPLYKIDNIIITKKEFDTIKSLNNIREEKILFVLLCMVKQQSEVLKFTDGLVRYTITDLCKSARISVPADEREYILHNILIKGLISCPKKNDTKCLRVNFLEENGEAELILNEIDCQELAYAYLKLKNGSGFKRCRRCGRLMNSRNKNDFCQYCVKSSQDGNHIWCIDCGDEVEISERDGQTCRCYTCQELFRRKYKTLKQQEYRSSFVDSSRKLTIQN